MPPASDAAADAERALVQLGYRPAEATRMIAAVGEAADDTEEMVRLALRNAAREGAA